ncbi:hypothetical protein [Pedobacter jejuensis]|uniref:Uncharacterized protein n=1 Tax=Pedobacter jejuensis TaxID=1268550 RepID=A0A3N0BPI0_9SPHI|nr:hypothetical protein [Pedobacter jejuensis]RNL50762.1 hypothetical protein D7004_17900 [Pedobacter jejuensis]
MKKVKVNFKEIPRFIDLNGIDCTPADLVQVLSNGIFTGVSSVKLAIELDGIARKLHKGEDAEVTSEELQEVINIVDAIKLYVPWCQRIIIDFLTNKLNTK